MRVLRVAASLVAVALVAVFVPVVEVGAQPGAPTLTGYPQGTIGSDNAAFTYFEPAADSYQCRVFDTGTAEGARPAWANCSGGSNGYHMATSQPEGARTFEVRAVEGGTPGPSTEHDWVVTSDPVVQWITEPTGTYDSRYVTATFTAPGATSFQCRLNGLPANFGSCAGSSGQQGMWTSAQLANGAYTLEVRAVDAGGSGPVATANFNVAADLDIDWISKPEGTTSSRYVTATFTAPLATGFDCRIDLGSWSTCSGSSQQQGMWESTRLADGEHTLEVRAEDAKGTGTVASTTFTVSGALGVNWVSRPTGTFTSRYVTATFTATGAADFQCRLDGLPEAWGNCSGSSGQQGMWTSPQLDPGTHTLEVRARDNGNIGPVASTTFTVQRPLTVEWIARPQGTIDGTAASATFTAPGATGFKCKVDGGTYANCGSGIQGTWAGTPGTGAHTLYVKALDGTVEGPEASTAFTIAPTAGSSLDVAVTSGPAAGSTIATSWAALSWSAAGAECYRVELDGADNDLSDKSCYTPYNAYLSLYGHHPNLADGTHTLRVQAEATGGEKGPVLEHTFTVETDPLLTVAVASGPAAGSTIATSWAALSWQAPGAECYRVELDGADNDLSDKSCYTPYNAYLSLYDSYTNLADGTHTLRVQAESTGDTTGPLLEHTFTVETDPLLTVAVASGPAAGSTIATSWAALSWQAPGAECYRVELDGADNDLSDKSCYTPYNAYLSLYDSYTNLADGTHTLRVQAESTGDTTGPLLEHTFTVETDPLLTVAVASGPAAGSTIATSWAALSWQAPGAECYRVELDGADNDLSDKSCYTPYNAYLSLYDSYTNLADGTHTLRVQAESTGDTTGPLLEHTFTVKSGPWVSFWSRPRTVLPTGTAALSWSAPGAACYRVELDGPDNDLSDKSCYTPYNAYLSLYGNYTNLADGTHTLRVQAEAGGGAKGPVGTATFTVEAKAPETTITAKPLQNANSATATFEFDADEPATFECRIDGGTYQPCGSPWTLTGLSEGPHDVEIRATDGFGSVDATPATWSWKVDTVAPVIIDLDGPPPVTVDPDAVLTFDADEPATFECQLNGSAWEACNSPKSYPGLPDDSYTFKVRAKDLAGNTGDPATRAWVLGTDPPETVIDSGPAPLVNTADATIAFSSPDAGVTFECRLDTEEFAPCSTPQTRTGLGDGPHAFAVRAVNGGALADPTPATITWTVDTTAPTVTIDSGPSGTVGVGPATFTFSSSEQATLYCSVDGAAPEVCTSPRYLGVLTGTSHTFSVYATDLAGNTGPATPRAWTVDEVAPVVTITSQPPDHTNASDATVEFTVDDPTAGVECSIDGQAFGSCGPTPGSITLTGLGDGPHSVSVQATDPVGNESAPAVASWRVDTIDPVVTITGGTPDVTSSTTGEVTFTVEDESPTTTECRVDGVDPDPWSPCTSGETFPALGEGPHTIEVRATDEASNVGPVANRQFTVDTTAPVVIITDGPTGTVSDPEAEISFEVTDANATTTTCSLDGGAFTDCTSPKAYSGLGNGSHTVTVRAEDAAHNQGEASTTWTVETLEPDTTITAHPPVLSNSATAEFTFTSDVGGATFECSLDGGDWESCDSTSSFPGLSDDDHTLGVRATAGGLTDLTPATFTWTVDTTAPVLELTGAPSGTTTVDDSVFEFTVDDPDAVTSCRLDSDDDNDWSPCDSGFVPTVGDGEHTVEIRAVDPAGNVSNIETTTWTVDATLPTVQITSGPTGNINVRDATFTFTVDDDDLDTVECRVDLGAWVPCTSPEQLEDLEDGPHSFDVRAKDKAGNVSAEGRTFFVDATGPTVEITDGPSGVTTSTGATIRFTVDDPDATVECRLDSAPWAPCVPGEDLVFSTLTEGPHTFEVRATDELDNVGSDERSWTVDTIAPTVTITSGPDGEINTDDAAFEFTADEPVDFECRLDSSVVDGTWEPCGDTRPSSVEYQDLAVDDYVLRVRGTDTAGLSSETTRGFSVRFLGEPAVNVSVAGVTAAGIPLASTGLGDDFSYRVTLTNNGAATAQDLRVEVPLSGDVTLRGALPTGCTSPDDDGPVTCTRATLGVDATVTIDVPVEATFDCDVWGDSANNSLNGTTNGETICGGGGNDTIQGRGGNDVVFGYGPRSIGGGTLSVRTAAGLTYGPGDLSGTSAADAIVTIAGTDGADNITTATGNDLINGEEGNDFIVAGGGTDTISGGDDDDEIQTGSGGGDVDAGPGNDTVTGGSGVDIVQGGPGNDRLLGDSDNDRLDGDAGNDALDGGMGNDRLSGGDDNDTLYGQSGDDDLFGNDGDDLADGGNGNDALYGQSGNDALYGQSGDDNLLGGDGNDFADGGNGTDTVYGQNGDDTVRGGNGSDAAVNGQEGRDSVYGDSGDDVVVAGGDDDDYLVDGGPGNDQVFGNDGNDSNVNGGDGNDEVHGGNGNDVVRGGFGNDRVDGDGGDDYLNGEWGNDDLNGDAGDDELNGGWDNDVLNGGGDNDQLFGDYGDDELNGGDGNDDLFGDWGDDNLNGDTGDDRLYGGWGRDILRGYAGNDRLLGGPDHDYLDGNAGDDYLNGQEGRDVLRGNAGDDELDGGPAWGPAWLDAYDHWNRLYGDAGTDVCRYGPGLNANMTDYRDASCELRTPTTGPAGQGWLNGARVRLDRGASNPTEYPG